MTIGASAMIFTLTIGLILGAISGYYGGKIDNIIMRLTDLVLALPFLVLALTIIALLEKVTIGILVTVIAITSWPTLTRIVQRHVSFIKRTRIRTRRASNRGK